MDTSTTINMSSKIDFFNGTEWTTTVMTTATTRTAKGMLSEIEITALMVFFGFLSVFGLIANGITFFVINNIKKSVFNIFIMSLCVSDFISALNSPMMVYRSLQEIVDHYLAPDVLCKIGQGLDYWTSIATIQHILLFNILRLACITFPHKFKLFTTKHSKIIVSLIWMETLVLASVYFGWPAVQTVNPETQSQRCTMQRSWAPYIFKYAMVAYPVLIYAPMLLVTLTCISIFAVLVKRKRMMKKNQRQTKENFALLQLTLIVASFLVGYSADVIFRVTAISARRNGNPLSDRQEFTYSIIAHGVLRVSEILNPFFYNFGSTELRTATKTFLKRMCGIRISNDISTIA